MVVSRVPFGDYFVLHMLGKNLEGFLFNNLMDEMAVHLSNTQPDETSRPNRFTRQNSKLSEMVSNAGRRASESAAGKTNYLPLDEYPTKVVN